MQLIRGTDNHAMTTSSDNLSGLAEGPTNRRQCVRPSKAADSLGVCTLTLRRWAMAGKLPYYVTPSGHFRYDIDAYLARVMRDPKAAA